MRLGRRRRWRIYGERAPNGSFLIHPLTRQPKAKLPRGALVSADGNWAEVRDSEGVARVLVRGAR